MNRWLFLSLIVLLPCALLSEQPEKVKPASLAPLPKQVPAPKNNPTTPAKVELGRQLFFDVRLSGKPVLEQFDVIAASGNRYKAVVKEFKTVTATTDLTIDLVARKGSPILNGVEIVSED